MVQNKAAYYKILLGRRSQTVDVRVRSACIVKNANKRGCSLHNFQWSL